MVIISLRHPIKIIESELITRTDTANFKKFPTLADMARSREKESANPGFYIVEHHAIPYSLDPLRAFCFGYEQSSTRHSPPSRHAPRGGDSPTFSTPVERFIDIKNT